MNRGLIKRVIYEQNKVFIEINMDLNVNMEGINYNIIFINKEPKMIRSDERFEITCFALLDINKKYEFEFEYVGNNEPNTTSENFIKIKSIIMNF